MASYKLDQTMQQMPPEQILRAFSWSDPIVAGYVKNFFPLLVGDARRNMDRLGIGVTGQLRRAIYWKTWRASGGDVQMFTLIFQRYAKFVELALGKGHEFVPIEAIGGPRWKPIKRPDNKPRRAKPFIASELRMQVRKFTNMLISQFAYRGTGYVLWGLSDSNNPKDIRAFRDLQRQFIHITR